MLHQHTSMQSIYVAWQMFTFSKRPLGGPYCSCDVWKSSSLFVLDRNLSSMFGRGGGDGQELSPLTKRERSLFLVNREVSRALFFLDKLEGRLF